jgi:ABC-type transport system involved in multi-copper enzyme maturation permease subunit
VTGLRPHGFRRLVVAELFKLRHRPMLWVMLAIQAGLCALIPMIMYVVVRTSDKSNGAMSQSMQDLANDRLSFPGTLISTVSSSLSWGLPLLIVLTASAWGGEFAWGTLRLLLSRGTGRSDYCQSKVAAVFVIWMLLMGTGILCAFAAGAVATELANGNGLSAIGLTDIAEFVGKVLAGMLAGATYVTYTALLATQTRSTAFAVAGGLVTFFGDKLIGGIVLGLGFRPIAVLIKAGPSFNVGSLTGDSGGSSNPVPLAVAVLLIYSTVFLLATIRTLRQIDVTVAGVG